MAFLEIGTPASSHSQRRWVDSACNCGPECCLKIFYDQVYGAEHVAALPEIANVLWTSG